LVVVAGDRPYPPATAFNDLLDVIDWIVADAPLDAGLLRTLTSGVPRLGRRGEVGAGPDFFQLNFTLNLLEGQDET
jgi:hypothetical protein